MTPRVFVSYSHDSEEHGAWVRRLATDLRGNGVDAILDEWDLAPGQDVVAFMQRGIAESTRVLLISSEAYVKKADAGTGGVGYERLIVTAELVQNIDTKKFIPIVRGNPGATKTPVFLGPRRYVDFTRDEDYPVKLDELLREIHGVPTGKPLLGPNPFSGTVPAAVMAPRTVGATGVTASGQDLLDDRWFADNATSATRGLADLGLGGSMELRFALHEPINKSQLELLNAVRQAEIHTFGWPIAVTLESRDEYKPRPVADGIRAEIPIPARLLSGSPSYDYWAIRNTGDFYLLKSLFEDERTQNKLFFNTRIVRVTESLMFAARLYRNLGVAPEMRSSIRVTHLGLAGRELSSSNPDRDVEGGRVAVENISRAQIIETLGTMDQHLAENVHRITESLFMLFDFAEFTSPVYEEIITNFQRGRVT